MKKIISLVCLLAMMACVFASCDIVHVHEFDTENWTHDADYHWHACTVNDNCEEKQDNAEHTFEEALNDDGKLVNKCTVCGATNEKVSIAPEHEHTYSEQYSNSDNFHWFECTVEGCYEASAKSEHVFGNPDVTYTDSKVVIKYTCVDCAYEKVDEQEVESKVDSALTWDEMFQGFKLTNFTMDVFLKDNESEQTNHCVVTTDSAYYCIPENAEFYTVKNADGTCTTYKRNSSSEPFTKTNDTSDYYLVGAQTETVIQISFEEHFDKFTYDEATGSYVCSEVIAGEYFSFTGVSYGTINCYNSVVTVVDGKISAISAYYYFYEEELQYDEKSFSYYNIGISAVEIPQSVINGAIAEQE